MEYLFSYGTLQKNDAQLKLFGRLLDGLKDTLKGYTTSAIEINDESFLAKGEERWQLTAAVSSDDVINGMVFEVSPEELAKADQYEPEGYERIVVRLDSGKQAWLYLAA